MKSYHHKSCLAAMILALCVGSVRPLEAVDLTQPLTAEEVACNEGQLERLLRRMNSAQEAYRTPQLPNNLLVTYSNSVGFYEGLVATSRWFRLGPGEAPPVPPYEHYLAFNLNPSIRTLLLNPRRPALSQVSLNREQSSSNFVAPDSYFSLTLRLKQILGSGETLVINNFAEPAVGEPYNGFLANSTLPGRGLSADRLLAPCHEKFTEFDRHVFAILERMARALALNVALLPDSEISIFRGEAPNAYRVNVYPIYEGLEERGRLATELAISWTTSGKLESAAMRILPDCTAEGQNGCTALRSASPVLFLIPPVAGGSEQYPSDASKNGVFYVWNEGPSAPKSIDLGALLAHTTWNRPIW
jgi:hypothetical protein